MVNDKNLLRRASEHNKGLNCESDSSDHLGQKQMGGMHIHLLIIFSDETAWLARILRQNHTSFTDNMCNHCLRNEFATLEWLQGMNMPSPNLHHFGLRNDPENDVGVA
jgi:hypothetical protein